MIEQEPKFIIFKKLLIFGAEGSGKSTMSNILEKNEYNEDEEETQHNNDEGK